MVRIVNGQVVNSAAVQKRAKGPLDLVAGLFWSVVSFFVLFFQTMFKPSEGGSKRVEGKPRVKTINPGGSSNTQLNGSPPFCGGGG
mmetsp:Transcript_107154/g.130740  ORF Transcript_107154/g.130740 Transcript_107154/m.130740 type:complete len:86 (+) Transcript_107154:71-328(+)|eukprot:CAMPEP_0114665722 /NCGR_PEP_ID=MMETSP0191-20121206/31290_1 /TAXON_ID=126664 /ORGANISM="Sorites sp." /LENGTH=85 /DNA_ID=CAMNT_0001911545 /DNA_START=67 /DNA_END=324 /DNA_ORIENTATION=-